MAPPTSPSEALWLPPHPSRCPLGNQPSPCCPPPAVSWSLSQDALDGLMLEGENIVSAARKAIVRHDFSAVLTVFPILRHLKQTKPEFDQVLQVCGGKALGIRGGGGGVPRGLPRESAEGEWKQLTSSMKDERQPAGVRGGTQLGTRLSYRHSLWLRTVAGALACCAAVCFLRERPPAPRTSCPVSSPPWRRLEPKHWRTLLTTSR